MMELFGEVFSGWQLFAGNQKLVAVLFVVLLFLWSKDQWKEQRELCFFGLAGTVLCLFPPTAILLMKYQTRFFDYQWIWVFVPILLYVAYGTTIFLKNVWNDQSLGRIKKIAASVFMVMILICCSNLGQSYSKNVMVVENQKQMEEILDAVKESVSDGDICLWAPTEFMAYAREYDGNIKLLYGRNMWDPALNAYSYDVYSPEQNDCYQWMEGFCENGKIKQNGVKGTACVKQAFDMGVTHLILPEDIDSKVLKRLQRKAGVTAQPLDGYVLLTRE